MLCFQQTGNDLETSKLLYSASFLHNPKERLYDCKSNIKADTIQTKNIILRILFFQTRLVV